MIVEMHPNRRRVLLCEGCRGSGKPEALATLLKAAKEAHHEYEHLNGVDNDWEAWYAGWILGLTPELYPVGS